MTAKRPVAIVPAAGASSRMGQPKALLQWHGGTLLAYQIEQLRAAGIDDCIVVAGCESGPVVDEATALGATAVINEAWEEGRASSVRAGAAVVPDDADPIVMLNVDQPRPAAVIAAVLEAYRLHPDAAVVVPIHEARRGHPVLFAGRLLGELRSVREESQGMRAVVARYAAQTHEVAVDSPIIHIDLNTPADYEAALQSLAPLTSASEVQP